MFAVEGVNTPSSSAFGSQVVEVDTHEQWEAYDALSPRLRVFLQEAPIDLCSVEVAEMVDMFGEHFALKTYDESLQDWVADYRASFLARTL